MRVGVPTGFLTATWRAVYYQNRPGNVANPDGVGFYPANRDRVNFNRPQKVGSDFDYFSRNLAFLTRRDKPELAQTLDYGLDKAQAAGSTAKILRTYLPLDPW